MDNPVTALIMLGPGGISDFENLVHSSRRQAAISVAEILATLPHVTKLIVAAPESELEHWGMEPEYTQLADFVQWDFDPPSTNFHFGNRISEIAVRLKLERLLYVGAGSMPLMNRDTLKEVVRKLSNASKHWAITNNFHSSDWLGLTNASLLCDIARRLPRDNMLGWALKDQAGYKVHTLPPSAATQLDIDTPTDLVALRWHPDTPKKLRSFLAQQLPSGPLSRWKAAAKVLDTPGSHVALIGRVSPHTWQVLQSHTKIWIRVFSEEQGMTSNGRWGGGSVRSLLANFVEHSGPEVMFDDLSEIVDAAFIDTRVYLSHLGKWPSTSDRYASDMLQPGYIVDARLREFTEAAISCNSQILLGAFGIVSGGLYALVETLQSGKEWLLDTE